MKAKRMVLLLLAAAVFAASACVFRVKPSPSNKPKPTAAPTEAATEEPAAVPTAEPLVFPTPGRTGNLIGGTLFDEPAKYFLIHGESNMHYVYDNCGALIASFSAGFDESSSWHTSSGFYGEHGAPFGYSIERGEFLPPYYEVFGDIAIDYTITYYLNDEGERSLGVFLEGIKDYTFENDVPMDAAPEYSVFEWSGAETASAMKAYKLGWAGAVLHIDGKYLILDRDVDLSKDYTYYAPYLITVGASLLDENGAFIGNPDVSAFGVITGVFGGKYIIGEHLLDESEWTQGEYGKTVQTIHNLYTLSGELVASRITPIGYDGFTVDDEVNWGRVVLANYFKDENGQFYDKELKAIAEPSLEQIYSEAPQRIYEPMEIEDRVFARGEVYAGIKDGEGNWLFRIYNPAGASDSQNSDHWPSWYWDYYYKENYGD
ncbi:MAG: PT domain-containing protein [Clostridia bacterium]|nr:PT domain-containing protein [Clostridia bacterium]